MAFWRGVIEKARIGCMVLLVCAADSIFSRGQTNDLFKLPVTVANGTLLSSAAVDFDRDGRPELLALTTNGVTILRNSSSRFQLSFSPTVSLPLSGFPYPADFDRDGQVDLLAGGYNTLHLWRNESPAGEISSFSPALELMTNSAPVIEVTPFRIQTLDVDGDGRAEVLWLGNFNVVYHNVSTPGNLRFTAFTNALPVTSTNVIFADLDGDTLPDLYARSGTFLRSTFFRNTSTPGSFQFTVETIRLLPVPELISDITGDGKPDLIAITQVPRFSDPFGREFSTSITLRKNLSSPGQIRFGPAITAPFPEYDLDIWRSPRLLVTEFFADLDQDGRQDFLRFSNGILSFFRNRSSDAPNYLHLEFAPPIQVSVSSLLPRLALADFNADNAPDIAYSPPGQTVAVMLNTIPPERYLHLAVPSRNRRLLLGETVEVFGFGYPHSEVARLDLYLDDQLIVSTNGNALTTSIPLEKSGVRRVELRSFTKANQLLSSERTSVLVVDQLNVQVRARRFPQQSFSSSAFILDTNNHLYGFGSNLSGQLGLGHTSSKELFPALVPTPGESAGWASVAAGLRTTVGLTLEGKLYAWGDNASGEFATFSPTNSTAPFLIENPSADSIIQVSAGERHFLALTSAGQVLSWGLNSFGQLGIGHNRPTNGIHLPPSPNTTWTNITTGGGSSFAWSSTGTLYAWGRNELGQLAIGHTNEIYTPTKVPFSETQSIVQVAAGHTHTLFLTANGTLYGAGANTALLGFGSLSTNLPSVVSSPTPISPDKHWLTVSASPTHNLAFDASGTLHIWGVPGFWVNSIHQPTPVFTTNDLTFTQVVAKPGSLFGVSSLGIATDGLVYELGTRYELDPSNTNRLLHFPQVICTLDGICPGVTNFPPTVRAIFPQRGSLLPENGVVFLEAEVSDVDGIVDNVELLARDLPFSGTSVTNLVQRLTEPPFIFAITNPGPFIGTRYYFFQVRDNGGAVTSTPPVQITFPQVSSYTLPVTNTFTGAMEFSLTVNSGTFNLSGVGLVITNLPDGVRVLNAVSMTNGFPLIQHSAPILGTSSGRLAVELAGSVPTNWLPRASIVNYRADAAPVPSGPLEHITSIVKFPSYAGLQIPPSSSEQFVEYSHDLQIWFISPVPIAPGGSRWADNGPPRTISPPSNAQFRFYRLRRAAP